MTGLVLLAVLAGAPEPSAVVLARRLSVSAAEAEVLVDRIGQRLELPAALSAAQTQQRLNALALRDATGCGGEAACHAELARQLGVRWLVLVSVSRISQDESLALELFDATTERVVDTESVLLETPGEVPLGSVAGFRARVVQHLGPLDVTPRASPQEVPVVMQPIAVPVAPAWRPLRLVVGAVGVAALGTAVGFLFSGFSLRGQLGEGERGMDGLVRSALSGSQAQQLNAASTVQLSLSGALGALGLGLLGVSIVWPW